MRKQGFTVIEVLVVSAFLIAAGVVLLFQIQRMNTETTNGQKRVAINAMYYSLEEAFYPEHKFYPETIDKDTLKTMDSSLLTDPNGKTVKTVNVALTHFGQSWKTKKTSSKQIANYRVGQPVGHF